MARTIESCPSVSDRIPNPVFKSVWEINRAKRQMLVLPLTRVSGPAPYGYQIVPGNSDIIEPIESVYEYIVQAREYLKTCSYNEVAVWLSKVTDKPISYNGLFNLMRLRQPAEEIIITKEDGKKGLLDRERREQLYTAALY